MQIQRLEDLEILPRELGSGYISRVYLARHRPSGQLFAVKIVEMKNVSKDEIETLNRELQTQKSLFHPNIVRLLNWFQTKDRLFIVLEHIEGGNLFEFNKKFLADHEVAKIFYEVVSAVAFLHERGILHRDIKPENILIDSKGNMKLCDFGFCAPFGEGINRRTLCGTKEYLPPEILTSGQQNEKVDIWCLGVLLYELLNKKTPFEGKSPLIFEGVLRTRRLPLSERINREFRQMILECLSFDPNQRPSATHLLGFPILAQFNQKLFDSKPADKNVKIKINQLNINFYNVSTASPNPQKENICQQNNLQKASTNKPRFASQEPKNHAISLPPTVYFPYKPPSQPFFNQIQINPGPNNCFDFQTKKQPIFQSFERVKKIEEYQKLSIDESSKEAHQSSHFRQELRSVQKETPTKETRTRPQSCDISCKKSAIGSYNASNATPIKQPVFSSTHSSIASNHTSFSSSVSNQPMQTVRVVKVISPFPASKQYFVNNSYWRPENSIQLNCPPSNFSMKSESNEPSFVFFRQIQSQNRKTEQARVQESPMLKTWNESQFPQHAFSKTVSRDIFHGFH